jgi:hypothetical protein
VAVQAADTFIADVMPVVELDGLVDGIELVRRVWRSH